jgi:hypothetical protein
LRLDERVVLACWLDKISLSLTPVPLAVISSGAFYSENLLVVTFLTSGLRVALSDFTLAQLDD